MENLIIYKNKENKFNCQFEADGVNLSDLTVRLCLESDISNMYFYGSINENGECLINIPKINEQLGKKAKLHVEAIVNESYFVLYKANVDIKNTVDIKMKVLESTLHDEDADIKPSIKIHASMTSSTEEPISVQESGTKENSYLPKRFRKFRE